MSNEFSTFDREARDFYNKGHLREAALTWHQARQYAQKLGLAAEAFQAGAKEALSWDLAGNYRRALGLYLELSHAIPPTAPAREEWLVQQRLFLLSMRYFPEIKRLQDQLTKLESIVLSRNQRYVGDISYLNGEIQRRCGHFLSALRHYEQAWLQKDHLLYFKSFPAYRATWSLLKLGRFDEAAQWLTKLEELDEEFSSDNVNYKITLLTTKIHCLIAKGQLDPLTDTLQSLKSAMAGNDYTEWRQDLSELSARVALLYREGGDPARLAHPARMAVTERLLGHPTFYQRFNHRLLLTDYRLACLRYTLGVSPVEDLWYHTAQQPPTPNSLHGGNQVAAYHRRDKTRAAIHWARLLAQDLDQRLDCTYYCTTVDQRSQRLAELEAPMGIAWGGDSPFQQYRSS